MYEAFIIEGLKMQQCEFRENFENSRNVKFNFPLFDTDLVNSAKIFNIVH